MVREKIAHLLRNHQNYDRWVYNILEPHINLDRTLSVGCGEGRAERLLKESRGIDIVGVEVTMYGEQKIPVKLYDGIKLPFGRKTFDTTMFIYMLHHSENIEGMLKEARRVTRRDIIIMDHTYTGFATKSLLKLYDYFSNVFYGMPIPFNFLKADQWLGLFERLGLSVQEARVTAPMNVFFKLRV